MRDVRNFSRQQRSASVEHYTPDRLSFMHQVKRPVDVGERHGVSDHRVDLDLAVHVPVDDLGYVGAPARAAEGGAAPDSSGHELERSSCNFLAGTGDADDHAFAPAPVAAFERSAHEV